MFVIPLSMRLLRAHTAIWDYAVTLVAVGLLSLGVGPAVIAQVDRANGTYVDNGDGKVSWSPQPPSQFHPEYWRIDYYRCSDLSRAKHPWGSDSGPTVENVMAKLKRSQKIYEMDRKFLSDCI